MSPSWKVFVSVFFRRRRSRFPFLSLRDDTFLESHCAPSTLTQLQPTSRSLKVFRRPFLSENYRPGRARLKLWSNNSKWIEMTASTWNAVFEIECAVLTPSSTLYTFIPINFIPCQCTAMHSHPAPPHFDVASNFPTQTMCTLLESTTRCCRVSTHYRHTRRWGVTFKSKFPVWKTSEMPRVSSAKVWRTSLLLSSTICPEAFINSRLHTGSEGSV